MSEQIDPKSKRQQAFLRRLAAAKKRLTAAIAGLDEETLCRESVTDDWTIKDILGHLVSWNEEFRANIAMILQGEHPGYDHQIRGEDDFRAWNQQWVNSKRSWSWDQIMADLERDYQEAADLIASLKPADYQKRGVTPWQDAAAQQPSELAKDDTESVATLVTYHWRHMHQHAGEIEAWRKQRR